MDGWVPLEGKKDLTIRILPPYGGMNQPANFPGLPDPIMRYHHRVLIEGKPQILSLGSETHRLLMQTLLEPRHSWYQRLWYWVRSYLVKWKILRPLDRVFRIKRKSGPREDQEYVVEEA